MIEEKDKLEFKKLKNLEKTFLSFLELTPDFIYIKDTQHRFLYTSDSFAKLVNLNSWKDLIGKTDFDIFPKEHADKYYKNEKDVIQKGKNINGLEEPYFNQDGKLCYVTSNKRPMYDENNNLIGLFGISRDITKTKELESKLKIEAHHDTLTNLHNRGFFLEQTQILLEICKRENKKAVIYFIDLNKFKPINDNYGHEVGDVVLKVCASRLKEKFRKSDLVCRFGGDEFLVFTIMEDDEKLLFNLKNTIKKLISNKPIKYENISLKLNCSVGYATFPKDEQEIENLIKIADKRMYKDKKGL